MVYCLWEFVFECFYLKMKGCSWKCRWHSEECQYIFIFLYMSKDIVDIPSWVFLGPENQPNALVKNIVSSAYWATFQEWVRKVLFGESKTYTMPPRLRESKLKNVINAVLDRLSLLGLDFWIQTEKDREAALKNLLQHTESEHSH